MKQNSRLKGIFISLLFMFLVVGCSNESSSSENEGSSGEDTVLRVVTQLNPNHAIIEGSVMPWMEKVEELTEGEIQFETFTSAELVAGDEELNALSNGTADIAIIHPTYFPDQFPLSEVSMLPLLQGDVEIASYALKNLMESDIELENNETFYESQFENNDLFAFALPTIWPYSMSTTGTEFNSVNDIEGLSVRSPSRIHDIYGEKIGISTPTIGGSEVYEALSRGTIDGTFNGVADWTGWGYQDVLRYTVTGLEFGYFPMMITFGSDTWEELSPDAQEALSQAHEEVYDEGIQEWYNRIDSVVEANEEQGGKFVDIAELDEEVQNHLSSGVGETWLDYIELLENEGLPGKEIVILWRDLIIEEGGEVPEEAMNLE